MKKRDSPNFEKRVYNQIIVSDLYLVQHSKIFYLYDDKPPQQGILDMEELCLETNNSKDDDFLVYRNGPILIDNS